MSKHAFILLTLLISLTLAQGIQDSLSRLHISYLDLYLIHSPFLPEGSSLKEIWQEMELCVDQGLVRSIGVSNFRISDLQELLSFARIKVDLWGDLWAEGLASCRQPPENVWTVIQVVCYMCTRLVQFASDTLWISLVSKAWMRHTALH